MSCESKINVPVCHFVIDKHVNFVVITSGIFVLFNEVLIQCIKANLIRGMFYILVDKTHYYTFYYFTSIFNSTLTHK